MKVGIMLSNQQLASTDMVSALEEQFIMLRLARDRFVIGSPDECWDQLKPYWEELGVTHFVFCTHFLGMPVSNAIHSMRLISEEVLPERHKVKPTLLSDVVPLP
ncbi:hypothetical protein [Candidatus Entotheonella palauensis]|uniref:hypothetical protein n=1 Tax=Candidatus Entotheonella palauensis TaxID=93172 RepID=UPI000B7CAFA0|nr:hypothetical protein [Candidatus Entotheonella palauensis]